MCVHHLTIEPRRFELCAYADRGAAHHDWLRAQEVHGRGRIQVVFWQKHGNREIQTDFLSMTLSFQILILFLTKHDGGVSLKRIKRTLPFAILCCFPKSQLAVFIDLQKRQSAVSATERQVLANSELLAVSPCNHTRGQKHWFHTHTYGHPPFYAGFLCSSCSPSVYQFENPVILPA